MTTSHSHVFGQDKVRAGERRTIIVMILTAVTMLVEIAAGILFGSMALLADGLHMASHAAALAVSLAAYILARRFASDERFSFGTGKLNSLAAFASALLLVFFAAGMAGESIKRLIHPVAISFDQAIAVAVIGLAVNIVSVFILGGHGEHREHEHGHHHHHDHNLRAAYLHVLADALTSVLAIAALLCGRFLGWNWLDPMMGIAGAILVARWSWGLLRDASRVLLDRQAPQHEMEEIRAAIENDRDVRVTDLHVWSIGPGIFAAAITLSDTQHRSPEHFHSRLPHHPHIVHATIEVHA